MNKTNLMKASIVVISVFGPIDSLAVMVSGSLGLVDDVASIALLIRILLKK